MGKCYITVTWMGCHSVMSHEKCGNIAHRPCSSCISSIQEMNKNSIKFFLSTWTRVGLSCLGWSLIQCS